MRYIPYLLIYLILQLLTYLITPILPFFAVRAMGWSMNGHIWQEGWRLPSWLSWFDTPDNNLDGDQNHMNNYIFYPRYLRHLFWLYRNSLYGFKWTVLACKVEEPSLILSEGDPRVNRNNGREGLYKATYPGGYWQWKLVKTLYKDRGLMWNFGWQLDEFAFQPKGGMALFQFSPRIVRIRQWT